MKGEALAEKQRQNEAFGSLLQDLRERRNWNRTDLAFYCGLDRSTIRLLELGIRSPTLNTLSGLQTPSAF
ncbi:MAG: XRE family transcriptional regulator, partial [Limnothrix sp. CACIAM 69d]